MTLVCFKWLHIFNFGVVDGYYELGLIPKCFDSEENIFKFQGFTLQWMIMEIFLFCNFLVTMFWLIARSAFMNLRSDYLTYFRPEFLAMTLNTIVDELPIKTTKDKEA